MPQIGPPDDLYREAGAPRSPGRLRVARRIFGGLALAALVPILALLVVANGLTSSALALTALIIGIALLTLANTPAAGSRRTATLAAASACAMTVVTFLAARLFAAPPPQAFRYVEGGRRDASPPWVSRVADERETVLAGLYFSSALGLIKGQEMNHLNLLLRDAYAPPWRPWPNAPLLFASPGAPRHLEHVPDGAARSPCVVFLHGFGGQLTAYLKSLHEGLGERFIIVAPFLDSTGAFWTPRGKEAVRALVTRDLPDQVDRDRVLLVGLSNGAVGATAIMQDPELSTHFRGFVLVSGIGEASAPSVRANVLVIAGADDERFPLLSMQRGAEALRGRGAQVKVVTLQADHFLLLSHAKEMAAAIGQWQW